MSVTISPSAVEVITAFFEAYQAHDLERMVELCSDNADFHYIPFEVWGKQRVIRGDGKVRTVGKALWATLIDAFPDLTNKVTSITADDEGNVAAEVRISGTHATPYGTIANQRLHYDLPHVFLFRVGRDGLVEEISGYWDTADFYRQLGRLEVDSQAEKVSWHITSKRMHSLHDKEEIMTRMRREEWYNIARDVEWTLSYADEEAVFPEWMTGAGKVPREAWKSWDEPYKCAYPDYVATQREKEGSVYAVKSALQRSNIFQSLDEGWKSTAKEHFGAVSLIEYLAVLSEQRMARFGLSPAWRNMAVYGTLDEIRHTQMDLFLAHEFIEKDPQFDWALKAYHTNEWGIIAARAAFDGMMVNPSAVDIAIQLPFTFETGFTNLQFVALAATALDSGDISFANMISSTQTDEARHAQQGGPTLEILMKHDPKRAQWIIDKTFWYSARLFAILTGPGMDYYTPLQHRKQSYKEFMEEWIVAEFLRLIDDSSEEHTS